MIPVNNSLLNACPVTSMVLKADRWHDNFSAILMVLDEIIIERIKTDGAISFRDFIEMALYYPGFGYYTSAGEKVAVRAIT